MDLLHCAEKFVMPKKKKKANFQYLRSSRRTASLC